MTSMSNSSTSDLRERVHQQLETLCIAGRALAVGSALDSSRLHSINGDGKRWQVERARLHAQILDPYRAVPPGGHANGLCALATAGPPAVGKTSAVEAVLGDTTGWRRVDADEFKELLIQNALDSDMLTYKEIMSDVFLDGLAVMPMELAGLFHVESAVLARRALELCMRNGENVIIEGTLQWDGLVGEYSAALCRSGYEYLTVIDVVTELQVALERAKSRWWQGRLANGLGGRFTPPQAIRDLYDRQDGTSRCSDNARKLVEEANQLGLDAKLEVLAPDPPPTSKHETIPA